MNSVSYSEHLVARVTGINKSIIVKKRKASLQQGADWMTEKNTVHYTPAGLEKLVGLLGLSGAALAWPAPGEGEQGGAENDAALQASDGADEALQAPPFVVLVAGKIGADPVGAPPAVGLPGQPIEDPATAAIAAKVLAIQETPLVELTVVKRSHNPTILQAKDADGVLVPVRVASNANFLPGMKLKARPPAKGAQPVYSMVGHCPRWPGRY